MEKKESKLEKDDDSNDDPKDNKSSKKKTSLNSKDINPNVEETESKEKPKKRKLADFFKKTDTEDEKVASETLKDRDVETSESEDAEYEPNLTEDEVHEATLVITEARLQEVSEELQSAEPDSAEEFEVLANAVFLEELQEIAEANENITRESIDQAYAEASRDLSLEDENDNYITENNQDDMALDSENGYNVDLADDSEESIENEEDSDVAVTYDNSGYNGGSGGYMNNMASATPSATRNDNYRNNFAGSSMQPNYTANNSRREVVVVGRRSDMLVGAVIGYIVGRRGGRKRTENKLQPKINKLEKQVGELHYEIVNKEDKIRFLARQKAEELERRKKLENNNSSVSEQKSTVVDEVIERRKVKKDIKQKLEKREKLAEDPSVEKIGKISLPALKIFHERRLLDGSENSPRRKQVEVMNESELLEKIEDLYINGHKVKEAYFVGVFNQDILRQITKEYLRGGPYRETFMRELLKSKHENETKKLAKENSSRKGSSESNSDTADRAKDNTLTKEDIEKKAEALLTHHSQNKKDSSKSRFMIATFTLLSLVIFIFIMLLTS